MSTGTSLLDPWLLLVKSAINVSHHRMDRNNASFGRWTNPTAKMMNVSVQMKGWIRFGVNFPTYHGSGVVSVDIEATNRDQVHVASHHVHHRNN